MAGQGRTWGAGVRPLAALSWQLCGAVVYKNWKRKVGAGRATFLYPLYWRAFGAAHPLAKKAWRVARSLHRDCCNRSVLYRHWT